MNDFACLNIVMLSLYHVSSDLSKCNNASCFKALSLALLSYNLVIKQVGVVL